MELADIIGIDRQTLSDYITYIEKTGLLNQLYDATGGIRGLGKVTKLYLENTNLAYVLGKDMPDTGNLRETFFLNQLAVTHDVSTY